MSAPLYSRYRRYIDRDVRTYGKLAPRMAGLLKKWKRRSTLVYSLSKQASYEAGWASSESPRTLLEMQQALYLPKEEVWVEVDWRAVMAGGLLVDVDNVSVAENYRDAPVRVGLMLSRGDTNNRQFVVLTYYLWKTGKTELGPAIYTIDKDGVPQHNRAVRDAIYKAKGFDIDDTGIGLGYRDRWSAEEPRLFNRLRKTFDALIPGKLDMATQHNAYVQILKEVHGTARLSMAILGAVIAAQPPGYVLDPGAEPREYKGRSGTTYEPYEIDLFLKPKTRTRCAVMASLKAVERRRKRLHTVGGHYAYRASKDGHDPHVCPVSDVHDFEKIDGTHSEVCVFCGQKRWWKAEHDRGDESQGVVPQKVRNIRAG